MLTTRKPLFSTLRTGLAVSALALALTACGGTKWGFPYRADVQQGNWITAEQVARLEPGMTREQVRFILGTPVLQDIFRTNRWDYTYFNKPGYGATEERQFTVWFEGDQLVRWAGDEPPNRQPFERYDTGATNSQGDASANDRKAAIDTKIAPDTELEINPERPVGPGIQSLPVNEPLR
ncbi:MAG: outer membrane protein assembly factor BamE [Pusillimonas sp.]